MITGTTPTRGEYVQLPWTTARYIGTRDRAPSYAYEGEDFEGLCRDFDLQDERIARLSNGGAS